jgi:hypothetical protein
MNLVLFSYVKYIKFSHLVILATSRSPRDLKCGDLFMLMFVLFLKVVVLNFPILGGLFQVYR